MRPRAWLFFALGCAISALALYFAFRNVPVSQLLAYAATVQWPWLLPALAVVVLSFVLRSWRWQLLLEAAEKIPFRQAYHPVMIGFMANCVLPGRVGELARPAILLRQRGVALPTGIATVAAERIFDLLLLIGLFAMVMATVTVDPVVRFQMGGYQLDRSILMAVSNTMVKLCLGLIVAAILICLEPSRRLIQRFIRVFFKGVYRLVPAWARTLDLKVAQPIDRIIDNVAEGFQLIRSPIKLMVCILLTICIWIAAALSYYLVAQGCPGLEKVTYFQHVASMVIICYAIALPSVPGFWGLWEAAGVFSLALFGVPTAEAAGFTLINHAMQVFPVIIMGLISAAITGINIFKITEKSETKGATHATGVHGASQR